MSSFLQKCIPLAIKHADIMASGGAWLGGSRSAFLISIANLIGAGILFWVDRFILVLAKQKLWIS